MKYFCINLPVSKLRSHSADNSTQGTLYVIKCRSWSQQASIAAAAADLYYPPLRIQSYLEANGFREDKFSL